MNAAEMKVGGFYNWKGQKERLVYIGCNWSGNGKWHQFTKVGEDTVWCEVLTPDLEMIEETIELDVEAEVLYYEAHVTIEPVFDTDLLFATELAKAHGFKIANLLMQKRVEDTPERSKHDTFMTGHSKDGTDLLTRMLALIEDLNSSGMKVWRYKIEIVALDSRINDKYNLLEKKQ